MLETITEFFKWCTVINLGLLTFSAVMCACCKGMIHKVHGKMFGLTPEQINACIYGYLGIFKVLFILFVLVPWIALLIIS
jgi:hypothetical protein